MKQAVSIGVLGAGAWGMSLSRLLSNAGHKITVWSALEKEVDGLSILRRHPTLPGMEIPEEIEFTKDIQEACSNKDIILFVVPAPYVRATARAARPFVRKGQIIVDVAKGIEEKTLFTMTEVIKDEIGKDVQLVALSGPSLATEVSKDLPTTIVSASEDIAVAEYIQDVFMCDELRVYTNPDVKGVELCGAMKNILALVAGVATGLGVGDCAKAALMTRGMYEITDLGIAMGCHKRTFYGLAGIGDLIVTATSLHSRNNKCGRLIGRGISPEDAVAQLGEDIEGVVTLPLAIQMMEKYQIDMPILSALNDVFNGKNPQDVVHELMTMPKKAE